MPSFKITNVSNVATGSRGHFLDMGVANGGRHIPVGGCIVLEAKNLELLPPCVLSWSKKGLVRVTNIDDGDSVVAGPAADVTPSAINPVSEMKGDDIMDDEPDLSDAHEAKLPEMEGTAPIDQSNAQTAKISDAMAEERHSLETSPIPGDVPVELGDAHKFSVKAPRSKQPGSVVKSK